ncbi:MAG: hypothetical protein U5O15_08220 [Candidatus Krumholzibacteriota bacterium]|nr:hypothetical protein [Candidatus Krumholzibacteriota bacterium]
MVNCLFKSWKDIIQNSIVEFYNDIGDSGFIVGSFHDAELFIDPKDIDVAIIFDYLDTEMLRVAIERAELLSQKLSNNFDSINFIPEFKQGPIKLANNNKQKQIHFFFFEYSAIQRKKGHPFLCSWLMNNSRLFGKELSQIINVRGIDRKVLINDINNTITSISQGKIWYWEFYQKENKNKLKMKMEWQNVNSRNQYLELIRYSRHIIRSFLLYLTENDSSKSQLLISESNRILELELYNRTHNEIVESKRFTFDKEVFHILNFLHTATNYLSKLKA